MKLLITGATGMIGQKIVEKCHEKGYTVHYLTRSHEKIEDRDNYKGFHWDVKEGQIDSKCLDGVDAIINLAGATIAERWTDDYKETILNSRIESLELLKSTLVNEKHQIKQIVSASAIGIYPDSLTKYYDESQNRVSSSFLGEVVNAWEAKVDEFETIGLLTTKIRIGLVLANEGGALPQMAKPIKYGMGAPFGSGKQWQSWIHLEDLANIFIHTVEKNLEGIFNGVAPNPVSNDDLTSAVADVLNKPLFLPNIPKFAMKLALGEMHILLFESQRVSSARIENAGYNFGYPNLKPALVDLLGKAD